MFQALHLQHNYLRYISPMSFYRTGSIVYMNLSMNHFDNMEHMGLRSTRNLEVLDVSGNQIRRVATNPLRNLDWLVELNLDNNAICKVQGEPFASMPRLKVLTMRNNRMKSVTESTFRHLRGNLALFDLEGKLRALHKIYICFPVRIIPMNAHKQNNTHTYLYTMIKSNTFPRIFFSAFFL